MTTWRLELVSLNLRTPWGALLLEFTWLSRKMAEVLACQVVILDGTTITLDVNVSNIVLDS